MSSPVASRVGVIGAGTMGNGSANAAATPVEAGLNLVLSEIDQNAKATFKSITLATMLRLIDRQPSATDRR